VAEHYAPTRIVTPEKMRGHISTDSPQLQFESHLISLSFKNNDWKERKAAVKKKRERRTCPKQEIIFCFNKWQFLKINNILK